MAINKVGSKGIEDGSVATADFAPGTVSSDKLQDNAVTNAKLTNTSVTLAGSSVSLGGSVSFNNKFVDWQSAITADGSTFNTAVSGQGYFIDTTSAVHTITLPASASIGDFIAIKDYAGTFATNNLTIARNGHNIQGVANDSLISTNRASLVLVYVDSTKGWLYWEEHNVADLGAPQFISATGGTVTESGDFKIHTFTGDGCFVVTSAGDGTSCQPSIVDYLVVAGGGGGGADLGGGGGAGGFREAKAAASPTHTASCHSVSPLASTTGITLTATTYPITVGAGGSAGTIGTPNSGVNGSNSVFSTITSAGGGRSSGGNPDTDYAAGGSGGGGPNGKVCGGAGNTPPVSPPQGNAGGGVGTPGCKIGGGGGGGGATAVGSQAPASGGNPAANPQPGGAGGAGATTSISGSPTGYAGGGGGSGRGPWNSKNGGAGGTGGGGTAADPAVASAGTTNTGGGGGGGAQNSQTPGPATVDGAAGGKGIVIIRYKFQ
jgi:hypothetical protein